MIVAPMNPNAVYVSVVPKGCCKTEFDSTYPIHLNGIISQNEFQESIQNINRVMSSRMPLLICAVIFALCIIGGMVLFIAGGVTAVTSRSFGFPVLVGVGIGVFLFGMIFCIISLCVIQARRSSQLHKLIAQESAKYCNRSPTPCSWRLNTTRTVYGSYNHRRTNITYHIVIEFGNSGSYMNGNAPQSSAPFAPNNYNPPPYGQVVGGFCAQCGAPRQSSGARFCPSCGQPFNKF